jgi:hypothetical protein
MTRTPNLTGTKIGAALSKGFKTTPVQKGGEFSLLSKDGKRRVATLSPRADYCILERLDKGVKVAGLTAAGKAERGRFIVTEADVPTAKEIITIALMYKPEPVEQGAAKATSIAKPKATKNVSRKVTESNQKPQPRKGAVPISAV